MTLRALPPFPTALHAGRPLSRALMIGAVLLACAGAPALAQSGGKPGASGNAADSVCASYGPGFQRVPGTDSCVRSGAAVRTDVYGGTAISNAPGQFNNPVTPVPAAGSTAPTPDPWKTAR